MFGKGLTLGPAVWGFLKNATVVGLSTIGLGYVVEKKTEVVDESTGELTEEGSISKFLDWAGKKWRGVENDQKAANVLEEQQKQSQRYVTDTAISAAQKDQEKQAEEASLKMNAQVSAFQGLLSRDVFWTGVFGNIIQALAQAFLPPESPVNALINKNVAEAERRLASKYYDKQIQKNIKVDSGTSAEDANNVTEAMESQRRPNQTGVDRFGPTPTNGPKVEAPKAATTPTAPALLPKLSLEQF